MTQLKEDTALVAAVMRAYGSPGNEHKHIDRDLVKAIVAELSKLDSCLGNVKDREPIFVLRAQDKLAEDIVLCWARDARNIGNLPVEKYARALRIAASMSEWPTRKYPD